MCYVTLKSWWRQKTKISKNYEHRTSNKKNANEEQDGGWKKKQKKTPLEDQDVKILGEVYSKMKEVSEERTITLQNTYIFFSGEISIIPAKPKIKKWKEWKIFEAKPSESLVSDCLKYINKC